MPQRPLDPDDSTGILTVRLPNKLTTRLRAEARRAGLSLSAHVRQRLNPPDASYASKTDTARLDQLEKRLQEVTAERDRLRKLAGARGVFSAKDYAALLKVVHPDNAASERTRAHVAQVVIASKDRLVRPEPPPKSKAKRS